MAAERNVRELAKAAGVLLSTWTPGDGTARYRFANVPGNYFSWSSRDILATCLGARAALQFLHGVVAGRRLERGQKSET